MTSLSFSPYHLLDSIPAGVQPIQTNPEMISYLEIVRLAANSPSIQLCKSDSVILAAEWNLPNNITHERYIADTVVALALQCGKKSLAYKPTTPARQQSLVNEINRSANTLRTANRRGCNFIWVNSATQEHLNSIKHLLVGYRIEVFDDIPDDTIIMSYKGNTGEMDAGIIVAPHDLTNPNKVSFGLFQQKNWNDYFGLLGLID